MLRRLICVIKLFRAYIGADPCLVTYVDRAASRTFTARICDSLLPVGTTAWFAGFVAPSTKLYVNCRFSSVSPTGVGGLKFTRRISRTYGGLVILSR